jgi:hypothetical protein
MLDKVRLQQRRELVLRTHHHAGRGPLLLQRAQGVGEIGADLGIGQRVAGRLGGLAQRRALQH